MKTTQHIVIFILIALLLLIIASLVAWRLYNTLPTSTGAITNGSYTFTVPPTWKKKAVEGDTQQWLWEQDGQMVAVWHCPIEARLLPSSGRKIIATDQKFLTTDTKSYTILLEMRDGTDVDLGYSQHLYFMPEGKKDSPSACWLSVYSQQPDSARQIFDSIVVTQ